jgi:hypothetical protein
LWATIPGRRFVQDGRRRACPTTETREAGNMPASHTGRRPVFRHATVFVRINETWLNQSVGVMAKCDVCGNDYDKSFQITAAGKTRTFDSFECAIHMLAPTCPHCDCKVIGHGVEAGGQIYCCVHCAEESGAHGLKDRS